jgi:hypothetical protein
LVFLSSLNKHYLSKANPVGDMTQKESTANLNKETSEFLLNVDIDKQLIRKEVLGQYNFEGL